MQLLKFITWRANYLILTGSLNYHVFCFAPVWVNVPCLQQVGFLFEKIILNKKEKKYMYKSYIFICISEMTLGIKHRKAVYNMYLSGYTMTCKLLYILHVHWYSFRQRFMFACGVENFSIFDIVAPSKFQNCMYSTCNF